MKKHAGGKSDRSVRTSSQSMAIELMAKFSGQPPRQKKIPSKKLTRKNGGQSTNGIKTTEASITELDGKMMQNIENMKDPSEIPSENGKTLVEREICERPESPVNPYNKFECKEPDEENRKLSLTKNAATLDGDDLTKKLSVENCSLCLLEKDNFCKAHALGKKVYCEIKARVEKAVKKHKIFSIRGDLPKLAKALEARGWVQKYESTKTRMLPYVNVASLDSKSMGTIKNPDGTVNERALVFELLRHTQPDFIWDCRNDFIEWDSSLRNHVILNRLQRSYVYTSKLGMAHVLQDSHWLIEPNVASVNYPRSYNVSRESNDFLTDYRMTAVTGLLKWYVERVEKGEAFVDLGPEPISISQLEFALERCGEFLMETSDRNIDIENDREKKSISDDQWYNFLDDYTRVLHRGNGIASSRNSEAQSRFEKCFLSASEALKNLKSLDPQYELNGMRNIWILKPSNLHCGTGISISHNWRLIMRRVEDKPKDYFVVQKYIEKPLLVKDTKFDIRMWYLVTNTFPLTIWVFEEALLRFSTKPYTLATYHEAIHICNTAVQQKYAYENRRRLRKRNNETESTDEGVRTAIVESIRDQEWDCAKLNEYLKSVGYKGEPYYDEIDPKMSQAVVLTMLASQEYMDKRRCSFELYGADFMVMDDLSVWLIEINTNPRMNPPSSKITQRLYDAVLESLVKVTMDLPLDPAADTGGFRLAYRQNVPKNFQPYLGPCLFVFGKRMTLHEGHENREKVAKDRSPSVCSPWKKQDRAWTAPATIPRSRDPKVVDFIDYLKESCCTVAR